MLPLNKSKSVKDNNLEKILLKILINTKHPAVNTVEHTLSAIAQKAIIGKQAKSVRKT